MPDLKLLNPGRQADLADLHGQVIAYADRVEELPSPEQVRNELHAVTTRQLPLQVAARFPLRSGDWDVQLRKSAFLHKSVPDGWWGDYGALARGRFRQHLMP
jgi:hypothetical protein